MSLLTNLNTQIIKDRNMGIAVVRTLVLTTDSHDGSSVKSHCNLFLIPTTQLGTAEN